MINSPVKLRVNTVVALSSSPFRSSRCTGCSTSRSSRARVSPPPTGEFFGAHVSGWGALVVTAVISAVPAAVLLVVAEKYVAAGVTGGAVK